MAAISRKVIEQIKDEIRADMILSGEVSLDENSLKRLADYVAPKLPPPKIQVDRADLRTVQQTIQETIKIPENGKHGQDGRDGRDGQDGKNLLYTPEIKNDIVDSAASLIDREEIAKQAAGLVDSRAIARQAAKQAAGLVKIPEVRADIDDETREAIIEAAMSRFVSRDAFKKRMDEIVEIVAKNKRPINAGISGQDMIEEINKTIGSGWQTARDFQAWGTFNGNGVPALYCGHNISSITDLGGQGHYRANFINPIVDSNGDPTADYGILTTPGRKTAGAARFMSPSFPTSTSVELFVYLPNVTPDDEDWLTFFVMRAC